MSSDIEEIISIIEKKHKVELNAEDPILIVHTLNEALIKSYKDIHQKSLIQREAALEKEMELWDKKVTEKAEKILNVSLDVSQKLFLKNDYFEKLELKINRLQSDLKKTILIVFISYLILIIYLTIIFISK